MEGRERVIIRGEGKGDWWRGGEGTHPAEDHGDGGEHFHHLLYVVEERSSSEANIIKLDPNSPPC
jgi:hypothetical protein